jgi:uncharacterized membrane protein YsdA (DUF1294 family)
MIIAIWYVAIINIIGFFIKGFDKTQAENSEEG